jgi:hypothetical protein
MFSRKRLFLFSLLIAPFAVFTLPSLALAYGPIQAQTCSGVNLSPAATFKTPSTTIPPAQLSVLLQAPTRSNYSVTCIGSGRLGKQIRL